MWKLVRNKIPEIMVANGKTPKALYIKDESLLLALRHKLVEEAKEVADLIQGNETFREALAEELADCQQVIEDIAKLANIEMNSIANEKEMKATARGGFRAGCMLHIE